MLEPEKRLQWRSSSTRTDHVISSSQVREENSDEIDLEMPTRTNRTRDAHSDKMGGWEGTKKEDDGVGESAVHREHYRSFVSLEWQQISGHYQHYPSIGWYQSDTER